MRTRLALLAAGALILALAAPARAQVSIAPQGGIFVNGAINGTCTNGYILYNNAGVLGCEVTPPASGIGVGTTAITGGTNGGIEYNNAGVLGELSSTGSGNVVLSTSPTLVTPALGTPSAVVLTNATGLPLASVTGLGTNVAAALAVNVGSAGAFVVNGGALGTPSSGTMTNTTGTPAGSLSGSTLASGVTASSLTSVGTLAGLTVTGSFTATGLVTNADLQHSTISGVALGSNLNALTFGTHLTSGGSSYNGTAGVTITSDATNANTASTIVARDGSGNFSAGTITASVTGHSSLDLALTGGTLSGTLTAANGGTWGASGLTVGGTLTGSDSGTWGSGGINGSAIGATTPSTGAFTAETLTGAITSTQTVSSLPSDLSKVNYVATQNVSSTLGAPATFTVIDKAAINHQIFNQLGGYNGDTGDGTKSTGVFANYTSIVTNSSTLGASGAYWVSGTLYGAMSGATDFQANPSIQSITGQFNAGQAGVFLQGIGDIDLVDNGFVAAGIGAVFGLDRTAVAGSPSLGTTWEGVSIQSFGSKEIDAAYHATGPTRIGLDLTGISNPNATTPVAIAMPAAWGIYGNATFSTSGSGTDCTSTAASAERANCVNPGTDFISDTAPGWQFVVSGSTQLQLNGSNIIMNAAPSFAGSTTGASTPSYTNSPCTGGTVRWIPALAAGQTGVWYVPLCK